MAARLKEEERKRLEAFAIGWILGTQQKHEQELDEEATGWFTFMNSAAVVISNGEELTAHGLSNLLGHFSLPEGEDLYDSVMKKLESDYYIDRINDLSQKVIKRGPGEVLLDKVYAEALRDQLNSYLDSASTK